MDSRKICVRTQKELLKRLLLWYYSSTTEKLATNGRFFLFLHLIFAL